MKLSVALTSRDSNSGSVNFIDDVRSFKVTHTLGVNSDQYGKLGELKFTFFIGDKLSKLEQPIAYLKEIDILEIEDELTAHYSAIVKNSLKIETDLLILDGEEKCQIDFNGLVLEKEKVKVYKPSTNTELLRHYANQQPIGASGYRSASPYTYPGMYSYIGSELLDNQLLFTKLNGITPIISITQIGKDIPVSFKGKSLVDLTALPYIPYHIVTYIDGALISGGASAGIVVDAELLNIETISKLTKDHPKNPAYAEIGIFRDQCGYASKSMDNSPIKTGWVRIAREIEDNEIKNGLYIADVGDMIKDRLKKEKTHFPLTNFKNLYIDGKIVPAEFYNNLVGIFRDHPELVWYDIDGEYFLDNCLENIIKYYSATRSK